MPAFYILLILGIIVLWFLLAFLFYPLGRFIYRIWKDAKDNMEKDDKKEEL